MPITYPQELPGPEKAPQTITDHRRSEKALFAPTFELGSTDMVSAMDVEFFFNADQAEAFDAYWSNVLDEGAFWFQASWPNVFADLNIYRFQGPLQWNHEGNSAFRVRGKVEMRGTSLAPDYFSVSRWHPVTVGFTRPTVAVVSEASGSECRAQSLSSRSRGKWWIEFVINNGPAAGDFDVAFGFAPDYDSVTGQLRYTSGAGTAAAGGDAPPPGFADGQRNGFAVDPALGRAWLWSGGSFVGGGDPVANTLPTLTFTPGPVRFFVKTDNDAATHQIELISGAGQILTRPQGFYPGF